MGSENKKYDVVSINNKLALLTYSRIKTSETLDGLYTYDIQSSDDGFNPRAIRKTIMVNHWGSIILKEPLLLDKNGWLYLDKSNFKYLNNTSLSQKEFKSLNIKQSSELLKKDEMEVIENDRDQIQIQ